jgi:hypothetical protein
MKTGIRYIITKNSDDGTFEAGDRILLSKDGSIICADARGWIDKEDVEEAIKGMEYKADQAWVEAEREKLNRQIKQLEEL